MLTYVWFDTCLQKILRAKFYSDLSLHWAGRNYEQQILMLRLVTDTLSWAFTQKYAPLSEMNILFENAGNRGFSSYHAGVPNAKGSRMVHDDIREEYLQSSAAISALFRSSLLL